jgi:hypothetical protein
MGSGVKNDIGDVFIGIVFVSSDFIFYFSRKSVAIMMAPH